jgi:hypothetical protein
VDGFSDPCGICEAARFHFLRGRSLDGFRDRASLLHTKRLYFPFYSILLDRWILLPKLIQQSKEVRQTLLLIPTLKLNQRCPRIARRHLQSLL